jgi:alkylation response protein AidB-like acyl-CoA dehydrogenase
LIDKGATHAYLAMNFAGDVALQAADRAADTGGYGYVRYPVELWLRNARLVLWKELPFVGVGYLNDQL